MARVATSRGTRLPYLGYHSSRKYQRSASGICLRARLSSWSCRNPDAAAFAAGRLGHEAQLVFAGDGGGVDLDELAVGVVGALLVDGGLRGAGADDGVGGLAEDGPMPPVADDDGVGGEGAESPWCAGPCAQMPRQTPLPSRTAERNSQPSYLVTLPSDFVAADLLVERVEELLAGGGAGEGGAVIERAAEAAEVEQAFGRAVEGHAHAVEQVDDGGRRFAHCLDGGLVGEEVAAVDGVVEVLPGGVAFALEVLGGVDAALRADGVRALDRDDGEEVDRCRRLRRS